MASYTCILGLNSSADAVVTAWSLPPGAAKEFLIGDTITFTSEVGDWRVDFTNSPFHPTDTPATFSAPVHNSRSSQLVRGGDITYSFDCILIVNGQTIGYISQGAGDDFKVKP